MGAETPSPTGGSRVSSRSRAPRLQPVEWALMAVLVLVPTLFTWHFASPSFFFNDDIYNLHFAHTGDLSISYAFGQALGHLAPAYRLAYLVIDRISPMDFDLALGFLLVCQAVSAVLMQRIFNLVFGGALWTYVLAFAWSISAVYLPAFMFFAGGILSLPTITATLASIHGYLCWRATGKRGWLIWSLAAMALGLAFYTRALLIPVYLVLMRVLLLDPDTSVKASLRSTVREWRVWLLYAGVGVAYLVVYALGDYQDAVETGQLTLEHVLRYIRVFWVNGFWPMAFGVRVPQFEQTALHQVAVVAAQLLLVGLIIWSLVRRRAAWRAWAFVLITVAINALMVLTRVSQYGPDAIGYYVRYYTEPALILPLGLAFAFAVPQLCARVSPVALATTTSQRLTGFRMPSVDAAALTAGVLAVYLGLTLSSADAMTEPFEGRPFTSQMENGRLSRDYLTNLRQDLAEQGRGGREPILVDHDVPEWVESGYFNLESDLTGIRYNLLSTVVPLLGESASFDRPGSLKVVDIDGRLQPTRFRSLAGGSIGEMERQGSVRFDAVRAARSEGRVCLATDDGGLIEWALERPLDADRALWVRAAYDARPEQVLALQSDLGLGFFDEFSTLPPIEGGGAAFARLSDFAGEGSVYAALRVIVPGSGQFCLGSLEIGKFDPPPPRPLPLPAAPE